MAVALTKSEVQSTDFDEINHYSRGKVLRDRMLEVISFYPSDLHAIEGDASATVSLDMQLEAIAKFKASVTSYVKSERSVKITIEIPSFDKVLPSILESLLQMTEKQLSEGDIRFKIKDDPAIDVDGVTKSILTKAAHEIGENPGQV